MSFILDSNDIQGYSQLTQKIANHFHSLGYKFVDALVFRRKVPHAYIHLVPHNGNEGDYKDAFKSIGKLQENTSQRPSVKEGRKIAKQFKL
jgi:hypothetical protein